MKNLPLMYLDAKPPKLAVPIRQLNTRILAPGRREQGLGFMDYTDWTSSKTTLVGWYMRNKRTMAPKTVKAIMTW